MKYLILMSCILLSPTVFSQVKLDDQTYKQGQDILKKHKKPILSAQTNKSSFAFPQAKRIDSTSMGIVYALPKDQMPCIVPDMDQFQSMPNVGSNLNVKTQFKKIPNPYPIYPLIPKKKIDSK